MATETSKSGKFGGSRPDLPSALSRDRLRNFMSRTTRIELIVLVVVLAILATPFLIPLNMYRGQIEAAASRALSREVHIKGPLHLTFYPDLGLSLADVSIANVPGTRDPQMITAEKLVAGAKLMPLFSGELEVTELTLEKPVIHLEVAKDATPNWSFGKTPDSGKPADAAALNRIGFSHLNINNGSVTYYNAMSGKSAALSDVSLALNMPDAARPTLALPLTLMGSLTYNNEKLKIDGRLDNFGNLLNSRTTGARIAIGSNVINAEFTGQLGTASNLTGSLKLGAHSVRSLAAWLGNPMPLGNGFGLLALEGHFVAGDGVYSLTHAHLAFDQGPGHHRPAEHQPLSRAGRGRRHRQSRQGESRQSQCADVARRIEGDECRSDADRWRAASARSQTRAGDR
jgi:AsmA protein